MTLKRKLLSSIIGLSTLPLFPIAITSCSKPGNGDIYDYSDPSKPLPNISNELNDKLNGLWEEKNSTIEKGLYTTKLATSLENKLISSNTTKTEEEVQNIADQKFKNLTESELKEYLVNNLNITSHKQYLDEATSSGFKKEVNLSTSRKFMTDVQKLIFDKNNSTVSFELVWGGFQQASISVDNRSAKYSLVESKIYKISNLKLEPFVRKIKINNNNQTKTILIPSIKISSKQLENTQMELVEYSVAGDEKELRKFAEIDYDFREFGGEELSKEEYINRFLYGDGSIVIEKPLLEAIKKLGNKLGQINDIFTIKEDYSQEIYLDFNFEYRFNIFGNYGYKYVDNDPKMVELDSLKINSSIMYSKNEGNEIDWEIYDLRS